MDSKKLNKLCAEARIQSFTVSETFVDNDTDKEKLQKLKTVIQRINSLEQTKRKIAEEISVTEEEVKEEIGSIQVNFGEVSDGIYAFLERALCSPNRAEKIEKMEEILSDFDFLEEQRIRLEILKERLNFEEVEHDNQ